MKVIGSVQKKLFSALGSIGSIEGNWMKGVAIARTGEAIGHGVSFDERSLLMMLDLIGQFQNGFEVSGNHDGDVFGKVGFINKNSVSVVDGVLRGDIQLYTDNEIEEVSAKASAILKRAIRAPDTFGLSVEIVLEIETIGNEDFIRPVRFDEVSFVDTPACGKGIFVGKSSLDICRFRSYSSSG